MGNMYKWRLKTEVQKQELHNWHQHQLFMSWVSFIMVSLWFVSVNTMSNLTYPTTLSNLIHQWKGLLEDTAMSSAAFNHQYDHFMSDKASGHLLHLLHDVQVNGRYLCKTLTDKSVYSLRNIQGNVTMACQLLSSSHVTLGISVRWRQSNFKQSLSCPGNCLIFIAVKPSWTTS